MFKPKPYQEATLTRLADCLEAARFDSPKAAFDAAIREVPPPWTKPYAPLEQLPDTPYLCLRLPTGGGKTFLAAQAVKVGARFLGREHNPLVLWLVPTDAIRQQTLETLTKPGHPNRQTLTDDFGEDKVRIVDIADVTDLTPQDYRDKACIVIGTFAALRVERTEGRKFYAHTEALEPHFAAVPSNVPELEVHTEGPQKGSIKKSCANLMALIRPLVIVDEAHNAKTELSYDVLNRVRAGCVIEFTATPAVDSNVLHHVSASILKDEAMIKLPIILAEKPSWQEALTDSILQRAKLGELAKNEKDFVRPIVLIQAESKDREVTVEVMEKYLIEHEKIDRTRIAIATGNQRDLDGVNLLDPACSIEFVITVQALKEGWDCPFAYVFCSVASVHSEKDVEQLLGRVLRMPWAQKRTHPDLNRAYAFVSKECWPHAVSLLHDRLVHMGFDEVEATRYLKPVEPPVFAFAEPPREDLVLTLREPPSLDDFPYAIRSQVVVSRTEGGTYTVAIKGGVSQEVEEKIVAAAAPAQQAEVRRTLAARRERVLQPLPARPHRPTIKVPRLCVVVDGELQLAEEEHFISPDSWSLLDHASELTEAEFRIEERTDLYEIDVQGKRLVERHLSTQSAFAFSEVPTEWTDLQLSRELDPPLRRNGIRQEVLLEFIRRTLRFLVDRRGISLNTLYRVRAPLERALREKIDRYRCAALQRGYQQCLFAPEASVQTSFDYSFAFDPEGYPAARHYHGGFRFPKHFDPDMVAAFDSDEELECAKAIEMCAHVKQWARNVPGMFGLPVWSGTFYPDFVAQLEDDRILVVEYKGAHLVEHDQPKKNVGELWENRSGGKALFLWATKKDSAGRDVYRQLEDKISGKP